MNWTTAKIAAWLNGALEGAPDVVISKLARIEQAPEGSVTFLSDIKYKHHLAQTSASAIIVARTFTPDAPVSAALIRVDNPYLAFNQLLHRYAADLQEAPRIEDGAWIDDSATLGPDAYVGRQAYIAAGAVIGARARIYPGVYIGRNVRLGDDVIIYPNAVLYANTIVGARCVIHANAVIGSDGFGFLPDANRRYVKIPHVGQVILEDDVEIGAGAAIDRATLDITRIEQGVKIDNLVHVAHNVVIGEHTVIAAQAGVSGSTRIGKHCMIGGQVGFVGHITVGDGVQLDGQSGVNRSIDEPGAYRGSPANPMRRQLKIEVGQRHLPELYKRVEELEARLKALEPAATRNGQTDNVPA